MSHVQNSSEILIFCSYSHKDENYRSELESHLSLLKRSQQIRFWSDRRIQPGEDWRICIDEKIDSAKIILLLISSDFLSSDYCYGIEMERALRRHEEGLTRLIPIIIRHVDWEDSPLSFLQALPTNSVPVAGWADRDAAWTDVVVGIKSFLTKIQGTDKSLPNFSEKRIQSCRTPRYLLLNKLPKILSLILIEPEPILIRVGIPIDILKGEQSIEKWTYVCRWMALQTFEGCLIVIRLVDEIQQYRFSERLSQWAAEYISCYLNGIGPGGGGFRELVSNIAAYAGREENRWRQIKKEIESNSGEFNQPDEDIKYVELYIDRWMNGYNRLVQALENVLANDGKLIILENPNLKRA